MTRARRGRGYFLSWRANTATAVVAAPSIASGCHRSFTNSPASLAFWPARAPVWCGAVGEVGSGSAEPAPALDESPLNWEVKAENWDLTSVFSSRPERMSPRCWRRNWVRRRNSA
ncbi:hypothetical protein ACFFX0_28055 [Citricoccus parietis]|uniref:Secreted protein n=1 Tax=Citricoccus parietis TaxID=592307 RepID=A0ABV5G7B3_9MICC